jgi:Na+/proline symporter
VGTYIRILIGMAVGLVVGLVFTVFVIAAKVGFLVNTPRSTHGLLLAAFFAVPALAGGLIGLFWRRGR